MSTGPFSSTYSTLKPPPRGTSGRRRLYVSKTWYRNKKRDRGTPLPYTMNYAYSPDPPPNSGWSIDANDVGDAPNTLANQWCVNGVPQWDDLASNKALNRFVGKFKEGSDASLAVTLAEWRQSNTMIAERAGQLLRAFKAVKKGNIPLALKELGQKAMQGGSGWRPRSRDVAGQWLELHFGWVPLVQDIGNAIDVLQAPCPSSLVRGRATVNDVGKQLLGQYQWSTIWTYKVQVQIMAEVYITNPNLALANRMGFVNPATVAWELIPFSFLVDWFIPVGDFLNSFTDFLGYEVRKPRTTTTRRALTTQYYLQSTLPATQWSIGDAAYMRRVLSIPPKRLIVNTFKGLSVSRGATAISLLLQQFLSVKPGR